jgi:hypothetical protein
VPAAQPVLSGWLLGLTGTAALRSLCSYHATRCVRWASFLASCGFGFYRGANMSRTIGGSAVQALPVGSFVVLGVNPFTILGPMCPGCCLLLVPPSALCDPSFARAALRRCMSRLRLLDVYY